MADNEDIEPTEESASSAADGSDDALEESFADDSTGDGDSIDEEDIDDESELVTVGATAAGVSRAANRAGSAKKDRPTPRQRKPGSGRKGTTPVQFVKESVGELRKVVYPTGSQLANYFVVVLVFVLFIIAFVGLLDLGLGWAIFKVFS